MTGGTIGRVDAIGVSSPLDEPFGYAQGWVEERTATLVRVETRDGAVGWGECWGPIAGNRGLVEEFLADALLGADPLDVESLHDRLYDRSRAAFQSYVPLSAVSGLDVALWDLASRRLDVPVSTLLGGRRRDDVPAYATGHYFKHGAEIGEQYERIAAEAERNAAALGAVKLKIGLELLGYGVEEDVELVRRVREVVGEGTPLMVDANYAYTVPRAREVGRALEAIGARWFEEPIPPENVREYARLRDRLDVPIAAGECHAPHEFDRLLADGGIDVAQPDVTNVGGLTAARRVARRAADAGAEVCPHVWGTPVAIAAGLQLASTLPTEPWFEFDRSPNPLREELATGGFAVTDGRVTVPSGPGLGIEIDDDAVERFAVSADR